MGQTADAREHFHVGDGLSLHSRGGRPWDKVVSRRLAPDLHSGRDGKGGHFKLRVTMGIEAGRTTPTPYDSSKPWESIYKLLPQEVKFWILARSGTLAGPDMDGERGEEQSEATGGCGTGLIERGPGELQLWNQVQQAMHHRPLQGSQQREEGEQDKEDTSGERGAGETLGLERHHLVVVEIDIINLRREGEKGERPFATVGIMATHPVTTFQRERNAKIR